MPDSTPATARVYLAGQDPAGLAAFAQAVSDENSPQYGKYLSAADAKAKFDASDAQVKAVTAWLTGAGLKVTATTTHYVEVSGPTGALAKALGTSFHNFRTASGLRKAPVKDAVVPATVADDVLAVGNLTDAAATQKATSDAVSVAAAGPRRRTRPPAPPAPPPRTSPPRPRRRRPRCRPCRPARPTATTRTSPRVRPATRRTSRSRPARRAEPAAQGLRRHRLEGDRQGRHRRDHRRVRLPSIRPTPTPSRPRTETSRSPRSVQGGRDPRPVEQPARLRWTVVGRGGAGGRLCTASRRANVVSVGPTPARTPTWTPRWRPRRQPPGRCRLQLVGRDHARRSGDTTRL